MARRTLLHHKNARIPFFPVKISEKTLHSSDNCVKLNENHEEVSNHA
jgi:hypothetical protein